MKTALHLTKRTLAITGVIVSSALININALADATGNYVLKYDAKNTSEYQQKWANIYGPLSLSAGGSLSSRACGILPAFDMALKRAGWQ